MAVITISNELGSGGSDIGQRVAHNLGYQFVDKYTSDRIFRQYGLTKFNQVYGTAPSILDLLNSDNLLIVAMLNEIIEALAQRGNIVILGRAGFAVLGKYADVLNVHIKAALPDRVQRVLAREGLTDAAAVEEQIREDDNMHRKFVQRFYNRQWDDPSGFGLLLNTSALAVDTVVKQIVDAARALEQQSFDKDAMTTAGIKVDPVLADAVKKALAMSAPMEAA
jgi:cytidylate kinase